MLYQNKQGRVIEFLQKLNHYHAKKVSVQLVLIRDSSGKMGYLYESEFGNEFKKFPNNNGLSKLEIAEKKVIETALKRHKGNKNRTRLDLGITINTLVARIKKYGLGAHARRRVFVRGRKA